MPHFSRLRSGHQSADTLGFDLFADWQNQFHHIRRVLPSQPDSLLAATIQGMSKHPTRYYGNGDLHFITSSCYRREPLLGTVRRRDLFLTVLEQVRRRYQFVVVGYGSCPSIFTC